MTDLTNAASLLVSLFTVALGKPSTPDTGRHARRVVDLAYSFVRTGTAIFETPERITINVDNRYGVGTPHVTINWSGCGSQDAVSALAYAANITAAVATGNAIGDAMREWGRAGFTGGAMEGDAETAVLDALTAIHRATKTTVVDS